MTRENKLALVVGFALILFVGILISDHFSTARNQAAANLTRPNAAEPMLTRTNSSVIDLQPRTVPAPTTLVNPTTLAINEPARPEQRTMVDPYGTIYMGEQGVRPIPAETNAPSFATPEGFVVVPDEPPAEQVKIVHHDVRGGETLFAICRQYYGDVTLVQALAKYNDMNDPASVRSGRRLRIPPAEALGGRTTIALNASQTPSSTPTPPSKPATQTYTVRSGDSLTQIAQRFLGAKSKWKKLHEMNRDVIDDPDDLKVGTVLKVANG